MVSPEANPHSHDLAVPDTPTIYARARRADQANQTTGQDTVSPSRDWTFHVRSERKDVPVWHGAGWGDAIAVSTLPVLAACVEVRLIGSGNAIAEVSAVPIGVGALALVRHALHWISEAHHNRIASRQ